MHKFPLDVAVAADAIVAVADVDVAIDVVDDVDVAL